MSQASIISSSQSLFSRCCGGTKHSFFMSLGISANNEDVNPNKTAKLSNILAFFIVISFNFFIQYFDCCFFLKVTFCGKIDLKQCNLGVLIYSPWRGVEPPTLSLGRICSIQLSYQGFKRQKIWSVWRLEDWKLICKIAKRFLITNKFFCCAKKYDFSSILLFF